MRKMLYVLMGVLLISTGVEAKSFDRSVHHVPQHANQRLHQECVRVCHKKDKTALKVAAVSAGVIGTVALVAALAN